MIEIASATDQTTTFITYTTILKLEIKLKDKITILHKNFVQLIFPCYEAEDIFISRKCLAVCYQKKKKNVLQ